MLQALLVDPWPAWLAAPVLATALLVCGRAGFGGLGDWRLWAGLVAGGFLARLASGRFSPDFAHALWDQVLVPSLWIKAAVFLATGIAMGFAARRLGSLSGRWLLFGLTAAVTANALVHIAELW